MVQTIKTITIIFFLSALIAPIWGQDAKDQLMEKKQSWPISISLSSHSWSFPLTNIGRIKPFYPGFSLGTEFYYIKKERGRLMQTMEVGGFANSNQGSALYFNSNLTYRFTTRYGLMTEIGLGLGYYHGFYRSQTFLQNESGEYSAIANNGIPASSSNISFALGYDLSKRSDKKVVPFIRYQWIASTRYWSIIGIRPNGLLHLGVQIDFN